jgi:UDP-glucose 4-epimerase
VRVLITGGAGFIGSHLADALCARGDEVTILDDLSTGRQANIESLLGSDQVKFVKGSMDDESLVSELMTSVDCCFHLASPVGVRLVVSNPLDSILSNVRGADIVISAAARCDVPLLFASTSEIYGKNGSQPLTESSDRVLGPPTTARWSYSTAKAFGEVIALGFAHEHGARMVVARLFNAVGRRQTGAYGMVLPTLVQQAMADQDLTVFGDGSQTRCFTHVTDTVRALIGLMDAPLASGRAFNVGCPQEVRIIDLARLVVERTGSSSGIRLVPYSEAYPEGFEELGRRVPDCSEIEQLTGWKPERNVADAVEDVIAEHNIATEIGIAV